MADAPLRKMMRHIHALAGLPAGDAPTDRQLLERYAALREPDAFAALVERHGPLVLGVCRRVLRHEQDAEDAFQATFHVLARKAGGVRWHESVANWLYEVARRVSHKARAGSLCRQLRERPTDDVPEPKSTPESAWHDLSQVLDEELDRLPRRFREPLLLCYLEGKTRDEAAQELGWTIGTVKGRLERGREMLRQRLVNRGLSLSAALFGTLLAEGAASAAVPAALADAAVRGDITGSAALLSRGVLQSMFWTKLKWAAVLLLSAGCLGTGLSLAFSSGKPGGETVTAAEPATSKTREAVPALPERYRGEKVLVDYTIIFKDQDEREKGKHQTPEDLFKQAGLPVVERIGHLLLLDPKGRKPEDALKGVSSPVRLLGALVLRDGRFHESLAVRPHQFAQPCVALRGPGVDPGSRRTEALFQKYAAMPGLTVQKVDTTGGHAHEAEGNPWIIEIKPAKDRTLLDVFLLTKAENRIGFYYTAKKP